jgi:hypothetical protein
MLRCGLWPIRASGQDQPSGKSSKIQSPPCVGRQVYGEQFDLSIDRARPIVLKNSKLHAQQFSARCDFDRGCDAEFAGEASDRPCGAISVCAGRPPV